MEAREGRDSRYARPVQRLPEPPNAKTGWPWGVAPTAETEPGGAGHSWPRVTIVTPSYNQAEFLEETLRSVLLQGYPNLEYIVVDGGSTDGSVEIIRRYAPWLSRWSSERDRGQSHAINKGFAQATGDVFGWINSDDRLEPGALHHVAQQLGGTTRPRWLIGSCRVLDRESGEVGIRDGRLPDLRSMLRWTQNWFPQQSTFWNRAMWDAAGPLREDLHYTMDFALWVEMMEFGPPTVSDRVLSGYRFHSEAKTKSDAGVDRTDDELTRFWLGFLRRRLGGGARAAMGLDLARARTDMADLLTILQALGRRKRSFVRTITRRGS